MFKFRFNLWLFEVHINPRVVMIMTLKHFWGRKHIPSLFHYICVMLVTAFIMV